MSQTWYCYECGESCEIEERYYLDGEEVSSDTEGAEMVEVSVCCGAEYDDDPPTCPSCSGSGEGMYDGTTCSTCHGKGSV